MLFFLCYIYIYSLFQSIYVIIYDLKIVIIIVEFLSEMNVNKKQEIK